MKKKQLTRINLCMGIIMLMLVLTSTMGGKAVKMYGGITDCCVNTFDSGVLATNGDEDIRLAVVEPEITISNQVEKTVDRFAKNESQKSYLLYLSHCLLFRESKHWENQNFGDGGLAGGPLQFHEATYQAYRKEMIKKGLVDHVGSRLNLEDSIETMIWAVMDGRGTAWGPIKRGECK